MTHRQELLAVLLGFCFVTFLAYRHLQWITWQRSVDESQAYEQGPRTKQEMDVVKELINWKPAPKKKHHHRRHK